MEITTFDIKICYFKTNHSRIYLTVQQSRVKNASNEKLIPLHWHIVYTGHRETKMLHS